MNVSVVRHFFYIFSSISYYHNVRQKGNKEKIKEITSNKAKWRQQSRNAKYANTHMEMTEQVFLRHNKIQHWSNEVTHPYKPPQQTNKNKAQNKPSVLIQEMLGMEDNRKKSVTLKILGRLYNNVLANMN